MILEALTRASDAERLTGRAAHKPFDMGPFGRVDLGEVAEVRRSVAEDAALGHALEFAIVRAPLYPLGSHGLRIDRMAGASSAKPMGQDCGRKGLDLGEEGRLVTERSPGLGCSAHAAAHASVDQLIAARIVALNSAGVR